MTTPQEARALAKRLRADCPTVADGPAARVYCSVHDVDLREAVAMATEYAALRERQAQPSAWHYTITHIGKGCVEEYASVVDHERRDGISDASWAARKVIPTYAAPPAPARLTDDEIDDIWAGCSDNDDTINIHDLARAVERKVRGE